MQLLMGNTFVKLHLFLVFASGETSKTGKKLNPL